MPLCDEIYDDDLSGRAHELFYACKGRHHPVDPLSFLFHQSILRSTWIKTGSGAICGDSNLKAYMDFMCEAYPSSLGDQIRITLSAKKDRCSSTLCCKKDKTGQSLKLCGQCLVACYCSAECQRKHWKTHKLTCKPKGRKHCNTCGITGVVFKKCADCKTVRYCSKKCQKIDFWREGGHQSDCLDHNCDLLASLDKYL